MLQEPPDSEIARSDWRFSPTNLPQMLSDREDSGGVVMFVECQTKI